MKIACVGYRQWALNIYDSLEKTLNHNFLIIRSKLEYNEQTLRDFNPDLVLFYGWSWIINTRFLDDYKCLMLHPSPLPKYRGGSPIQNQIIAGEKISKISIFIMNSEIDSGDLVGQFNFSLQGSLSKIFSEIENIGYSLTLKIINEGLNPVPQNHAIATYFQRLDPSESEITIEDLKESTGEFLYNKVRMLANPYPNAYLRTKDGKKLVIVEARLEEFS